MKIKIANKDKVLLEKISALDYKLLGVGWSISNILDFANKDYSKIVAFIEQDEVIGHIIGYTSEYEYNILRIGVDEKYRRQGIASALIDFIIDDCKIEAIFLEVRSSNNAISFYEKCGFEKIQVRRNFYTNPTEDGIIMKRTINNV